MLFMLRRYMRARHARSIVLCAHLDILRRHSMPLIYIFLIMLYIVLRECHIRGYDEKKERLFKLRHYLQAEDETWVRHYLLLPRQLLPPETRVIIVFIIKPRCEFRHLLLKTCFHNIFLFEHLIHCNRERAHTWWAIISLLKRRETYIYDIIIYWDENEYKEKAADKECLERKEYDMTRTTCSHYKRHYYI